MYAERGRVGPILYWNARFITFNGMTDHPLTYAEREVLCVHTHMGI